MIRSGYKVLLSTRVHIVGLIILLALLACGRNSPIDNAENWVKQAQSKWPQITMTNQVVFDDTTFTDFASSFLVDTGTDTLAITCKNVFASFAAIGLFTVDFKDKLESWKMYPKNSCDDIVELGELVNRNPSEMAALPNIANNTDWLVFKVKSGNENIFPLKLGDGSFKAGEYLYNLGWGNEEKNGPSKLYKFKVFRMVGNQIFMQPVNFTEEPAGLSGSPIFNSKGQLVGILSGVEDNLARACSVYYLFDILKKHQLYVPSAK